METLTEKAHLEQNRYFMRNYFDWLKSKLLFIVSLGLVFERGVVNLYNNCWSNSVIQVLYSSFIKSELSSIEDCPTLACRYINRIMSDLHGDSSSAKAALTMTMEMRQLIAFFYQRDQKYISSQDDADDFLQLILQHLCENTTCDTPSQFQSRTINISSCLNCSVCKASKSNNVMIRLSITTDFENEMSVQSYLREWCTRGNESDTTLCCD